MDLITKAFICTGVTLIGMRGNKKSCILKWVALYRHKGFHCLLRIGRWEGFNVRNQVVKGQETSDLWLLPFMHERGM